MLPDKRSTSDPRTTTGGRRLVIGGIIAVVLVVAIMALLAGEPNPELGESLPNAPPHDIK
ncbi:hypothetical protein [Hyphomicrobium sp.]|uniref:hypothetical protein n=1 Tax=Hyphomicrobium sp. TaxID=82 RepID=UPI002FDD1554